MYSQNVTSGVQTINHKQYIVSTPLWKTVAPLVIEMVSWVCLPLFILFYLWIRYLHYLLLLKLWSPPISVVRLHAWSQSWRKHVHTVLQQEQKHSRRITSYVHNDKTTKCLCHCPFHCSCICLQLNHLLTLSISLLSPVSTSRADGPSWRVTGFHDLSTRLVETGL